MRVGTTQHCISSPLHSSGCFVLEISCTKAIVGMRSAYGEQILGDMLVRLSRKSYEVLINGTASPQFTAATAPHRMQYTWYAAALQLP